MRDRKVSHIIEIYMLENSWQEDEEEQKGKYREYGSPA